MKSGVNDITSENYVENVVRSESVDFPKIRERLKEKRLIRLLHCAMGLCTEAGEFMDHLKKHIFYGAELDPVNMIEELGDNQWYVGVGVDELEAKFNEMLQKNIDKLRARYPEKFEPEQAINRDLKKERSILEKSKSKKGIPCPACGSLIAEDAAQCWKCKIEFTEDNKDESGRDKN